MELVKVMLSRYWLIRVPCLTAFQWSVRLCWKLKGEYYCQPSKCQWKESPRQVERDRLGGDGAWAHIALRNGLCLWLCRQKIFYLWNSTLFYSDMWLYDMGTFSQLFSESWAWFGTLSGFYPYFAPTPNSINARLSNIWMQMFVVGKMATTDVLW